ncbi:3-dehydroquinate synthase [Desulfococcaceae bacterium HSG7]|nr:3-dehydroquinate synthase [Desulfococcaceae bacterium HSG7]
MQTFEIHGNNNISRLLVGEKLTNLETYLPESRTVIITDTVVKRLYGDLFPQRADVITIGCGEKIKTLDTVRRIYEQLIALDMDRTGFIVGIGGGIVCDITGFAASTYMRGVRFGFVASTLLAQTDASVGGKNGVNFGGYKNMAGVFNQPDFVICDMTLLSSLSKRELLCGFAEIIKHALIADVDMFNYLKENCSQALALNPQVIEKLVVDSIKIKAAAVSRDELEQGERRKLNFGHTIGHALEQTGRMPHGEAVSIGMAAATAFSAAKGFISSQYVTRIIDLITRYHLPVRSDIDPEQLLAAMRKDKKRTGAKIHFVFLKQLGEALVEAITFDELKELASCKIWQK